MRVALLLLASWLAVIPSGAVERTLGNGMRVILIPHRANPMVASAVIVGAGVVDEPADAAGASHFLEHLLFNGTTSRTQRQLYDDVDRLGAYNNATTREDHTLFTFLVAKEHAEGGLAIQSDMLFHSTIPEENFEKERKIVLEELARDRGDPSYDLEAAFRAYAFAGTPIARPVLGTEASLGGIKRADVLAYYKARYVPQNMTLVVMGDFDVDPMFAAIERRFGSVPRGAAVRDRRAVWPERPKDNVELVPAENDSTRLLAAFPVGGVPGDATAAAVDVLLSAATDGKDAPLAQALAARGIEPSSVGVSLDRRRAPWSTVSLDAEIPGPADATKLLGALDEAICATAPGGEARRRVPRVVARMTADDEIARDQIHYFAMLRSSSILGSPKDSVEQDAARLATLTTKDWDAASARLRAGLPAIRARLVGPGIQSSRVSWSPSSSACGTPEESAGSRTGQLANGLRYVIRRSGDSDVFALHLAFAPRAASEPAGRDGITDLLHRIMARATTVHGPAALEDRLAALGARVKLVDDPAVPFDDYYTTPEYSWIRLEAPAGSWREALGVVAEMVRFPDLSDEALSSARREMQERVTRRDGSPKDTAAGALDALLAPGHPLTRPVYGTAATLGAITLGDLEAFHKTAITGRRTIASVVSPVPVDDVVRALESDLGALAGGDAAAEPPQVAVTPTGGLSEAKLGKSQAYLAEGEVLDVPPGDRAALTVAVAMLSDRLTFDLRETKGLAYSMGASLRPWGGRTRFDITMGTRPENVDTARDGIAEGLRAFRESDPTPADVERAVNVTRGAALMRRMTRISLAYEAGLEALRGAEPGSERRFVDALKDVRVDDVKRVRDAYLDAGRLAVAIVR